jgi:hypothetical protein
MARVGVALELMTKEISRFSVLDLIAGVTKRYETMIDEWSCVLDLLILRIPSLFSYLLVMVFLILLSLVLFDLVGFRFNGRFEWHE